MGLVRRVLSVQWVTDPLQYILEQDRNLTILVVCAARDAFLEQLLATVRTQSMETAARHWLLTKTLGLLSASSKVRTVFCPTLEHLRAYLSAAVSRQIPVNDENRSLMVVLNPLSLHLSTREFSAQGLSRTLATAVEVSSRANMDLVLCECQDALNPTATECGEALWYVDVPLLNNSLRTETEGSNWTGRVVPVRRVAQRWFEFTEIG